MYTNERNIQMLIYLLKANNIRKVIINPGTMNMSFVNSLQNDSFFELYSCVDERSACYMACGLSVESDEPVVLTCTGATASRNYNPGLTEAYYRKIPIVAVTCTPHLANVGQNIPQVLDRSIQHNDTNKISVYIPPIKCENDEWNNTILLNKAILELRRNGGGPIHINLGTELTRVFDLKELPKFRIIKRYNINDLLPRLNDNNKIGIYIGNHKKMSEKLIESIDEFCEKYNAVVLCDQTSNYNGKYKILANIICDQEMYKFNGNNFDLIIHIGDVSGSYMVINTREVWRVNPDGEIRDSFRKLTNVFEMDEFSFFEKYNSFIENKKDISFYEKWLNEYNSFEDLFSKCQLPFSNVWIAREISKHMKKNSVVHLAILNSLRSWNYCNVDSSIRFYSNTGGFGIDGIMSTVIGASFYDKSKNYFAVIGDLAFFYDLNSLGNRHISNNLRILLINNGCGTEFHNYSHPANILGDGKISNYIAADGHFGKKSRTLVKDFAENLGFEYISADSKESCIEKIDYFVSDKIYDKPLIFEVFTSSDDESKALYLTRTLKIDKKQELKNKVNNIMSPKMKNKIKKMIGR